MTPTTEVAVAADSVELAVRQQRVLAVDVQADANCTLCSEAREIIDAAWMRTRPVSGRYTAFLSVHPDQPSIGEFGPFGGVRVRDTSFAEVAVADVVDHAELYELRRSGQVLRYRDVPLVSPRGVDTLVSALWETRAYEYETVDADDDSPSAFPDDDPLTITALECGAFYKDLEYGERWQVRHKALEDTLAELDVKIYGAHHSSTTPLPLLSSIGSLLSAPNKLTWTVRNALPTDCIATLIGEPAAGKSFLAIDLALCVACGIPWHGNNTRHGPVIYVCGEGRRGVVARAHAWFQHHGIEGIHMPFYLSRTTVYVDDPASLQQLIVEIDGISRLYGKPQLVVFDTLARTFSGKSENDNTEMGKFVRGCDEVRTRYSATVLVIHHPAKNAEGRMTARGAGALLGAVDVEAALHRGSDGIRKLVFSKMKDAEEPAPTKFAFHEVALPAQWNDDETGEPATSCVLIKVENDADAPPDGLSKNQRALVQAVVGLADPATGRIQVSKVLAFLTDGPDKKMGRSTFYSVIRQVVAAGKIGRDGNDLINPRIELDLIAKTYDASDPSKSESG